MLAAILAIFRFKLGMLPVLAGAGSQASCCTWPSG